LQTTARTVWVHADVHTSRAVPRTQSEIGDELHGSWTPRGGATISRSDSEEIKFKHDESARYNKSVLKNYLLSIEY